MVDESILYTKYESYIHSIVKRYISRIGERILSQHYEDLFSEAAMAFIETVRNMDIKDNTLNARQTVVVRNRMMYILRKYIWDRIFNMKSGGHGHLDMGRVITESDVFVPDEDKDNALMPSKYIPQFEDDGTSVWIQDFINSLSERDRTIVSSLMRGDSIVLIERRYGISRNTTAYRLKKIQQYYIKYIEQCGNIAD